MTQYSGPTQSDFRIIAPSFFRHALRVSAIGSFRKKSFFSAETPYPIVDLFEGLWRLGTRFRHYIAPVLGSEQKNWPCQPLPLLMAIGV